MKLGVHENYTGPTPSSLAKTAGQFPKVQVTREFEPDVLAPQSLTTRIERRCGMAWALNKTVVWSFKPEPGAVKSGAWRPHVEELARYLSAEGRAAKTVVVIWHEPENDMSAGAFVALYNRVHEWLTAVNPAIVTSHAALGWCYRNWTVKQAARWVTQATVHSIDLYSGRSFPLDMTLQSSASFQAWKKSRPAGSRWGVSERGWIANAAGAQERAASIAAEALYLLSLTPAEQPDFYIVWNTVGVENDPDIVLDPAGAGAVNRLFDSFR
jgi:hypothetical protein